MYSYKQYLKEVLCEIFFFKLHFQLHHQLNNQNNIICIIIIINNKNILSKNLSHLHPSKTFSLSFLLYFIGYN